MEPQQLPPIKYDDSGVRERASDQPNARVEKLRIDAFTDIFVCGCFMYLLISKTITDPTQVWALLGAMATIGGVGGWMRNSGKDGSATAAILSVAPKALGSIIVGSARHLLVLIVGGAALLGCFGCAGETPLQKGDRGLYAMHDLIIAACRQPPIIPQDKCDAAVSGYNDLQSVWSEVTQ